MTKQLIIITFLFLLAGQTAFGQTTKFPALEVNTLGGRTINISDYTENGKPTLISFWATWCKPCKLELDALMDFYPEWQEEYDLEIVAISTDNARYLPKVKPMVAQKQWDYIILNDPKDLFKTTLNFPTVPETFLLDKDGNIIYRHSGYISGDEYELEDELKKLK